MIHVRSKYTVVIIIEAGEIIHHFMSVQRSIRISADCIRHIETARCTEIRPEEEIAASLIFLQLSKKLCIPVLYLIAGGQKCITSVRHAGFCHGIEFVMCPGKFPHDAVFFFNGCKIIRFIIR